MQNPLYKSYMNGAEGFTTPIEMPDQEEHRELAVSLQNLLLLMCQEKAYRIVALPNGVQLGERELAITCVPQEAGRPYLATFRDGSEMEITAAYRAKMQSLEEALLRDLKIYKDKLESSKRARSEPEQ